MEAVADMIAAMEAAGVKPVEPIAKGLCDGELIRFRCEGDKPSRLNGWAILYLDGVPAGAFGNYKLGIRERWRSNAGTTLTNAERGIARLRERQRAEQRAREREQGWQRAADNAARLWERAGPVSLSHSYIVQKDMTGEGMRQHQAEILVPMCDAEGRLWNVQRIGRDGTKLFLKGGRTDGLFWLCGEPDAVVCIGEGVSTMAAVRRASGHAVAASFSEKNLMAVAQTIHTLWPMLDKIVCADDDAHLVDHPTIKRNLGMETARAAALAIGGRLAVPPREA